MYRREFLKNSALSIPLFSCSNFANSVGDKLFFEIGLAQWSFNRAITSGEMDNLDFVKVAKKKFDINVVEYVNQFFFNKAKDKNYLKEMLNISDDLGVKNYLIMNWYLKVLKQYADFNGRARRKEYWMFILFNAIVSTVLNVISPEVGGIYSLAVLIPTLAVLIRRMHDVGKSGWYILIPIYNLILALTDSESGENEYGVNPKD